MLLHKNMLTMKNKPQNMAENNGELLSMRVNENKLYIMAVSKNML